jgi:SAM-dependent methyltransferase
MPMVRDSGMPPQAVWESFFDPPAILDAFGAQTVDGDCLEFGCGYGTFTIPVAPRVSGVIYALDIDPDMIAATAARARGAGLANVVAEERDFVSAGSGRPAHSAGFAMLFNILHSEDPPALLAEAHRCLRRGGTLAVMHWLRDARTPRGPALEIRPTADECRRWAEDTGFRSLGTRELPGSPWHWGLLLERP